MHHQKTSFYSYAFFWNLALNLQNNDKLYGFDYFSDLALPKGERPRSYFLRAFCLCAFIRYFLVQKSYCVDFRMCMVAYELKRGNPMGLIWAEILNGLDAFHRKEANFFTGSPLLL